MQKVEKLQREKIVEVAKSWLRTPYHHMGRVKGAGADCLTVIASIYEEAGLIPRVDIGYYPQDWHMNRSEERYLKGLLQYTKEVETPLPGDIVLWKFGRCYSHGAIVIEWPFIIHSYMGVGCVYEDAEAAQFLKMNVNKNVSELRLCKFFSFWKQWE